METKGRRFEMVEGSSSKFWEIRVEGATYTVTYGRIGTPGVSKTTSCASAGEAQAEADKLVREKTKKGYQELGGEKNWRPPAHMGTFRHPERFMNYKITAFDPDADPEDEGGDEGRKALPALRDLDKRVFAVGISYDNSDEDFGERLDALLADPRIGELRGLVVGQWFSEVCEEGPSVLVEKLVANAPKLKSLKGLFVGDIVQEECEISWLHQVDYGPLLRALPGLEELVVRGGEGLRFSNLRHPNLKSLTIQTGGLPAECVRDVAGADLPELRVLTMWLGTDDYGGDSSVDDLAPILSGTSFPKLEHLGLQDSDYEDDIAVAAARAPIVSRLQGLDLSMGNLTDTGGQALLDSAYVRKLKHLNLRHHYLSPEMAKRLRGLGIEVNTADAQEPDDDYRFVEVAE
jgi:predicted DNA-binding WGR domain protein